MKIITHTGKPEIKIDFSKKLTPNSTKEKPGVPSKSKWRFLFNRWTGTIALCSSAALFFYLLASYAEAVRYRQQTNAIGALRHLNSSQAIYLERSKTQTYGTLTDLGNAQLIDEALAKGVIDGYSFELKVAPGQDAAYLYSIYSSPINNPTSKKSNHFFSDQSGVIRHAWGKAATVESHAS